MVVVDVDVSGLRAELERRRGVYRSAEGMADVVVRRNGGNQLRQKMGVTLGRRLIANSRTESGTLCCSVCTRDR